jgi:Fic family protein
MEAIFNSAGLAIYMPPPPGMIAPLITKLIKYANTDSEKFVPVKAVLVHFVFEKIHPFLDGNGRVGRLLMQKVLSTGGYGMKGLSSIEEYLDNRRPSYYRILEEPEKDTTEYVEFMLRAIAETANKAKEEVLAKQKPIEEDYLLPRRAEILRILKSQKILSFDQIKRRFQKVNARTLRYDLKKLRDQKLIRKLGETKGVYYTIKNIETPAE